MFVVKAAQLEHFNRAADAELLQVTLEHVRDQLPELAQDMQDEVLAAWVRDAISRARHLGLTDVQEIAAFVDAGLLLDDICFDVAPENGWAAEILGNPRMTSNEKGLALLDIAWLISSDDEDDDQDDDDVDDDEAAEPPLEPA
ncbi:MAG TPA: hypothetical protein VME47_03275 [Acetobacteraceae bacterium]|nr:hypothetical protein [Acetobacteraceae bacterium]